MFRFDFDVSQSNLLAILKKLFPDANVDEKGMCHGLCVLWAYGKWLETQPVENNTERDDNTWFRNVSINLAEHGISSLTQALTEANKQQLNEFFRFFNHIKLGQDPEQFFSGLTQSHLPEFFADTKGRKLNKEYLATFSTIANDPKEITEDNAVKDLAKKLEQIISENKLIFIESVNHATSLFKQGETIYFYDPNDKSGEKIFTDYESLANALFYAFDYSKNIPSLFNIEVFNFDIKKENKIYPTAENLLGENLVCEAYIDPSPIELFVFLDDINIHENEDFFIRLLQSNKINRSYIFIGSELFYILLKEENQNIFWKKITKNSTSVWPDLKKKLLEDHTDLQDNEQFKCISLNLSKIQLAKITLDTDHTTYYAERMSLLHMAAIYNNINAMEYLIKNGGQIDSMNERLETPFMLAMTRNSVDAIRILINHGANVTYKSVNEHTLLRFAISFLKIETIDYLFQSNLKIDINEEHPDGYSPILFLIYKQPTNLELIQFLIKNGANIHAVTNEGFSALELAATKGALATVKYLLDNHTINQEHLTDALIASIQNGYFEIAQLLIKNKVNVNKFNSKDQYPLYIAAAKGNMDIVNLLIQNGAEINASKNNGLRPIHAVIVHGHMKLLEFLVNQGADLNVKDNKGFSLIHFATRGIINPNIIQFLHEKGVDINDTSNNVSPLWLAVDNNHFIAAKKLLDLGADVNVFPTNNKSLLFLAVEKNNEEMVKLLLEKKCDVDFLSTDDQLSALHVAVSNEHVSILRHLLQSGVNVNIREKQEFSPLFTAAQIGNKEIVLLLLQAGADPNIAGDDGTTPLMAAAYGGHLDILEELLQHGARLDLADIQGNTVLHRTTAFSNNEALTILINYAIKNKMDTNPVNQDQITPLDLAFQYHNFTGAEILIKNGADINITMDENKTPLYLAVETNQVMLAYLILQRNPHLLNFSHYSHLTPLLVMSMQNDGKDMLELLLQTNISDDIDVSDKDGNTVFHLAVQNNDQKSMEILLSYGANPMIKNNAGDPPLFSLIKNKQAEIVEWLLERSIDLNVQDANGNTALHLAVLSRDEKMVQLFLIHGISENVKNKDGDTALHIATQNGYENIIKLITDHSANSNVANKQKDIAHTPSQQGIFSTTNYPLNEKVDKASQKNRY